MPTFVTIATFTLPTELAVVRGRLESEGIMCNVRDELTVQVYNLYSNAVGGVKLQVREEQEQEALHLLRELGYLSGEKSEDPTFWLKLDNWTGKIPWLGRVDLLAARLLMLLAVLLVVLALVFYFIFRTTTADLLVQNEWCVQQLVYNGGTYAPKTTGRAIQRLNCPGTIRFDPRGWVQLPGFGSEIVNGVWSLHSGELHIGEVDTFAHVYNGLYQVQVDNDQLTMYSENTTIFCRADHYSLW